MRLVLPTCLAKGWRKGKICVEITEKKEILIYDKYSFF